MRTFRGLFIAGLTVSMIVSATSIFAQEDGESRTDDIVIADEPTDEGRPAGGGGGQDIVVFDIVDSMADDSEESKATGGKSVFDVRKPH